MKKNITFLFLLAGLLIFSCKKKQPTSPADLEIPDPYFRVKIVEVGTGVPVPDADVYLFDEAENGTNLSFYGHMFSDENGEVSWLKTDSIDKICVQKEGYFNSCGTGYYLTEPPVSQGTYTMYPEAWIRISVVDDEPLNPDYFIEHSISEPGTFGYYGIAPGYTQVRRVKGNVDKTFYMLQLLYLDFELYDTLAFDEFTLNPPAFDTIDFVYHY